MKSAIRTSVLIVGKKGEKVRSLEKLLLSKGINAKYVWERDFGEEVLSERWNVILLSSSLEHLSPSIRSGGSFMPTPIILVYPSRRALKQNPLGTADDFIVLPISDDELVARIKGLRRKRRKIISEDGVKNAYETLRRITEATRAGSDDLAVLRIAIKEVERMITGVSCTIIVLGKDRTKANALSFEEKNEVRSIPLDLKKYPEIRRVMETRRLLDIKDVARHPLLREVRKFIKGKNLYSFLLIPIFFQEEMTGIFFLRSTEYKRSFPDIEISFMKMLAVTTATALRNVKLKKSIELELEKSKTAMKEAMLSGKISQRLEKLFEHTADGVIIVNQKGRIEEINRNFSRLSGYSKQESVGMKADKVFIPMSKDTEPLSRILKEGKKPPLADYQVLRKDGGINYVTVHLESLPGGDKKEYLLSLHDFTTHHELDMELRRIKDFLESVIQHSIDAIMAADMKGNILIFNKAAEKITGYEAQDVIGKKNITDIYFPGGAKDIMKKLRSKHYGGKGRLETCSSTLIAIDKSEIPINVSAAIIYNEQGKEVASVGVFQDLRERIEIEKQLRQAQERLLESQRRETVSALAGAAAHELNQPLTSIMGYAELLQRAEKSISSKISDNQSVNVLKTATEIIAKEAERMAEVVRKLGEVTDYDTREYYDGVRIMDLDLRRQKPEAFSQGNSMQSLFMSTPVGIIVIGEDTVITHANPHAEILAGESMTGKPFTKYLAQEYYPRAIEMFYELVKKGRNHGEFISKRTDGTNLRVFIQAARIAGHKEFVAVIQEVKEIAGGDGKTLEKHEEEKDEALWDINEIIRMEKDIGESLKQVLKRLNDICDFQVAGLLISGNDNNEMISLRYKRGEDNLTRTVIKLDQEWAEGIKPFAGEDSFVYNDIEKSGLSFKSSEVNEALDKIKAEEGLHSFLALPLVLQGQTMGFMYMAEKKRGAYKKCDVNFLRQVSSLISAALINTHLSEAKDQLMHSEKLAVLGQMIAGVAHEVSAPLTAIQSSAEIMKSNLVEDDHQKDMERTSRILEGAQRINSLMLNLRDFARPSTGIFVPVNVNDIIEKALAFAKYELDRENLCVETDISRDMPDIMAVEDKIQQVFINLISNAAHACENEESGKVIISARLSNDSAIEISVSDNGVGIEKGQYDKIFDPFYTTKSKEKGTGLGLSIVKEIVSLHKGTIRVESVPGEGSTFTVKLPLRKEVPK